MKTYLLFVNFRGREITAKTDREAVTFARGIIEGFKMGGCKDPRVQLYKEGGDVILMH